MIEFIRNRSFAKNHIRKAVTWNTSTNDRAAGYSSGTGDENCKRRHLNGPDPQEKLTQ